MATAVTPFQSPSTVAWVPVVVAAVGFSPVAVKVMGMPSDASGSRPASSCVQAVNRVAARQAAEMGIRVFTIGVGSAEGKPIPVSGGLLKDRDGNIVVSRLDEKTLMEVAKAGNGMYVKAGNSEFGLNPIVDEIDKMDDEQYSSVVFEEFDEQYMYFFALALVFLVMEMLIGERKIRRRLF